MPAFFPIFESSLFFHRCLQFWEEEKISGDQDRWIRWLRHDYGFGFSQKLTHKHGCMSWCISMAQNLWFVFPQFCAFPRNCFAQSAHNFKVVYLINRTTLWQEFMIHHCHCNRRKQWNTFDRIQDSSPVMTFLSKYGSTLIVVNISWFSNFGTIFAAARFMPNTSVKIACYQPRNMPTSSATSLYSDSTIIQNNFLHCFNVLPQCYTTIEIVFCL